MKRLWWLGFGLVLGACSDHQSPPTVVSRGLPLIGGQPDTATRGVVGVIVDQQSGCSGSLIAPNLVLTARHCVAAISSTSGTVQCGVTNFGQPFSAASFIVTPDDNIRNGVPAGAQYAVERVVTTPSNGVCGNDLSLLILAANVPASSPPIVPRVDGIVTADESFDAVGYGITNPNDTAGATFGQRLRVNGLNVLCVGNACTNLGGTRTEWGAVTPVCSGDSGGPALDASGRVIGVASRGNSDCDSALYSSVASWKSLIVDTAIDAATAGGYAPPSWTDTTMPDAGMPADAGMPSDAGTSDAGMRDSGTPDSGQADSGPEPDSGTTEPDAGGTVGERCDGVCPGGLACYQPNADSNRGVCVPHCSVLEPTCPLRYDCSGRLGVCVPREPDPPSEESKANDGGDSGGCGCRQAVRPGGRSAFVLAFLMLAAAARRRRR
jgi:hypothetical protein